MSVQPPAVCAERRVKCERPACSARVECLCKSGVYSRIPQPAVTLWVALAPQPRLQRIDRLGEPTLGGAPGSAGVGGQAACRVFRGSRECTGSE